MSKQQLKDLVRKANSPCEECGGKGLKQDYVPYIKPTIKSGTTGALNNIKPIIYCKTCNGKGYVSDIQNRVNIDTFVFSIEQYLQEQRKLIQDHD